MILAPMQGLTEVLFRRTYEECFPGAISLAVAPFISLTHNMQYARGASLAEQMKDVLPEANAGSIPIIPQILGKEPEEFIALGNRLYDMGYNELNWNIGCPMRAITGKHRGCGILPYPDEVRAVLDATLPKLKPRLSVKMRTGLKDKGEIFNMVPVLNDYPLASVTIHPRLGRQQYTGVPDTETFGQILPLLRHPVIYNGDICTPADEARIRTRFPQVADTMVGRGILYRPTLPLEVAGQPMDNEKRLLLTRQFVRNLMEAVRDHYVKEESALHKTKEYWCLLWKSLDISELEARKVLREKEFTIVDNLIWDLTQ